MVGLFFVIAIVSLIIVLGAFKYLYGRWPIPQHIEDKLAQTAYERVMLEDKADFRQTPLATSIAKNEIEKEIVLSKSFSSTHRGGSYGCLHVVIDNNEEISPIKANAENYYMRFEEDKDLSCLYWGNTTPSWYDKYKSGQAKAYTGCLRGVDWSWSGTQPIKTSLIMNFNGKKLLIDNQVVNELCYSLVE